jgi:hypothetical protein
MKPRSRPGAGAPAPGEPLRVQSRRGRLSDQLTTAYLVLSSAAIAVLIFVVVVLVGRLSQVTASVQADQAAQQANQVTQCRSSNKTRVRTSHVLNLIIDLPGTVKDQARIPAKVAARAAAIASLEQIMKVNYAPTNCAAAYHVG